MQPDDFADDAAQSARTLAVVQRYHQSWRARDLEAVLALYHPDIQYHDFYQQRCLGRDELRAYVAANLPRQADERLEHSDRIRVDGHTAFIQYRLQLQGSAGLLAFRSSEAISVRDDLIWRVHEYATLVNEARPQTQSAPQRPASSRLGLSPRQIGQMAADLQSFMQHQQPYLDPNLDLQQLADATGYSRNQLSFLFNQVLGQSFYRQISQLRLQHLLAQLTPGSDPQRIDALAFAAGFNSLSSFYSCFRRHCGQTPRAYLRQLSLRARTHDSSERQD